jgi:hypothetical protein
MMDKIKGFVNKSLGKSEPPAPPRNKQEMQTQIDFALAKLQGKEKNLRKQIDTTRKAAKEALKKGDDRGYKTYSRRYTLLNKQLDTTEGMQEKYSNMKDTLELQEGLSDIMEIGDSLHDIQDNLGIDSTEIERVASNIRNDMEKVDQASEMLTTSMGVAISKNTDLDNDDLQEELMAEIQSEEGLNDFEDMERELVD